MAETLEGDLIRVSVSRTSFTFGDKIVRAFSLVFTQGYELGLWHIERTIDVVTSRTPGKWQVRQRREGRLRKGGSNSADERLSQIVTEIAGRVLSGHRGIQLGILFYQQCKVCGRDELSVLGLINGGPL
jgi:hypothetical protein